MVLVKEEQDMFSAASKSSCCGLRRKNQKLLGLWNGEQELNHQTKKRGG